MTTDTSTTQREHDSASTAADEGKHVAGVAAGEARDVAAEAAQQARSVVADAVGEARVQLDDQGRQQKDRLAGTLAMFGDDLGRMSATGSGLAADLAQEVADRARSLSRHLDQREPGELLDDVRRFARQRPGTFLLGALAAGVIAGRLLRGTRDAVEAAEARDTPRVSPDMPDSYGRPTQPPSVSAPPVSAPPTQPPPTQPPPTQPPSVSSRPTATGYSSPPPDTELRGSDAPGGMTP